MIVGRSFAGKSIFGQNVVYHNPGVPSIFFSMEMPSMQALIRLYAMHFDKDAAQLQEEVETGNPPDNFWELVDAYNNHMIVDKPGITLEGMSESMEAFDSMHGTRPEFVVVDYLELLGGAKASAEGYLATEGQVTMLKDWAKIEQTRVFVLHQANRSEDRWKPITADSARNAGYTESDFFIGMWREHFNPDLDYYEKLTASSLVSFNVLKNRAYFRESEGTIHVPISASLRLGNIYERRSAAESSEEQPWDNTRTITGEAGPESIF